MPGERVMQEERRGGTQNGRGAYGAGAPASGAVGDGGMSSGGLCAPPRQAQAPDGSPPGVRGAPGAKRDQEPEQQP